MFLGKIKKKKLILSKGTYLFGDGMPHEERKSRTFRDRIKDPSLEEMKRQRRMALVLIPLLIFAIIFSSILLMKNANLYFNVNENNLQLSSDTGSYFSLQLITEHNDQEYRYNPSSSIQKIPKTSVLKGIEVVYNETALMQTTEVIETYSENFEFIEKQNKSNLIFEDGIFLGSANATWDDSENEFTKIFYYGFSFLDNNSEIKPQHVNNITIDFEIELNRSIDNYMDWEGISVWNVEKVRWDDFSSTKIYENYTKTGIVFPPVLYLNNTGFNSTILFRIRTSSGSGDYTINNIHFGVNATFWKEISEFTTEYINTLTLYQELTIKNTFEIKENRHTYTTITQVDTVIGFGSWIRNTSMTTSSEIVIYHHVHYFTFETQFDLMMKSWLGFRLIELDISSVNLSVHSIDYRLEPTRFLIA